MLRRKTAKQKTAKQGISPAIGMLLMVAVTVVIFVGVSNVFFNATSDAVGETADASVEVKNGEGELQVRLTSNKNAGKVFVRPPSGSGVPEKELSKVGSSVEVEAGGGTYQIVAVVNGTEQVLRTVEVDAPVKDPLKILSGPTKSTERGFNTTVVYDGKGTFDTLVVRDNRAGDKIDNLNIQSHPNAAPGKSPNEISIEAIKNGEDGKITTTAGKGKHSEIPTGKEVKFSNYVANSNPPKATEGKTKFQISVLGSEDKIKTVSKGESDSEDADSEDPHSEDADSEDPHSEDADSEDPHSEDPHSEDPHSEDPHSEDPHSEDPHSENPHSADLELVFKDTTNGTKMVVPISISTK